MKTLVFISIFVDHFNIFYQKCSKINHLEAVCILKSSKDGPSELKKASPDIA